MVAVDLGEWSRDGTTDACRVAIEVVNADMGAITELATTSI
jgi:hypothetical protein